MRRIAVALMASLLLIMTGCAGQSSPTGNAQLKVVTSFYPMYEFARHVAGEHAQVINLVPPGVEPHDWEPTAKDIRLLNEAKLFIYNGAGMEGWTKKTLVSLDNKSLTVVQSSEGLASIESTHTHGDGEAHTGSDPHIWLDPIRAIGQVEAIRNGLIKVDEANKAVYEANAAAYIAQLKALDEEFRTGLTGCGKKEFFTTHEAFSYLADRYGLEQHAIMGLAPDEEPTPKALAEIVEAAKEENIQYIFFETLVSNKVANVVAKEVGAQTLVLNPIEGLTDKEVKAGKSYLSVMRENLANLKLALECGQ